MGPIGGQLHNPRAEQMTLRDYFAAKAMQALIGNNANQADYETFAEHSYGMADAMLQERAK